MKKNITTALASMLFCLTASSVSFAQSGDSYQERIVDGERTCWIYEGYSGYVQTICSPAK